MADSIAGDIRNLYIWGKARMDGEPSFDSPIQIATLKSPVHFVISNGAVEERVNVPLLAKDTASYPDPLELCGFIAYNSPTSGIVTREDYIGMDSSGTVTARKFFKKLEFTGTEPWGLETPTINGTQYLRFSFSIPDSQNFGLMYSNLIYALKKEEMEPLYLNGTFPMLDCFAYNWYQILQIMILPSLLPNANVAGLQQLLSQKAAAGTPFTVYYPLQTPAVFELSRKTADAMNQLHTLDGTTSITLSDSETPFPELWFYYKKKRTGA